MATVAGIFLISYIKKNSAAHEIQALLFQKIFAVFLLLWSAGITIYDQRVSKNISVYLIAALTIAVIV